MNQLYLHTNMQVTFGINLVAIVHNRPELLSLKDLLHHFLEHRREVILRRTRYELKQAEARAHIPGRFPHRPGLAGCGHQYDPGHG